MKSIRRIYRWILISLIFQVAFLSYINYIYIPGRGKVQATMLETGTTGQKSLSVVELPAGAEEVKVSFDGKYAAYKYNETVIIVNIDKNENIKELKPDNGEFSCFSWIPDREMLIYAQKDVNGHSGQVLISTYDIGADLDRSYPIIKKLPKGSQIIDIELSPLTNIVCPIIKTSEDKVQVYKFDIMDNLTYVMNVNISTIIKETMYTDNIIYQQPGKKINILNGDKMKKKRLPVDEPDLLLDVDSNDNIYVALTEESGKAIMIYYGKSDQNAADWNIIKLESPCEPENIFITSMGRICLVDRLSNTIYSIDYESKTAYSGELIDVLDNYVVTLENNKLVLQVLEGCN